MPVKISGCVPDGSHSFTNKTAKHMASGFTYKVVSLEGAAPSVTYRGPNVPETFVQYMAAEWEKINALVENPKPLHLTPEEETNFWLVIDCHICGKQLDEDRVRDHCHLTGRYRGAAHNSCNINYKWKGRIPVVFHNLRGYDAHIIMQAIGSIPNAKLNCIPNNMEKYISFSMDNLDFIDSYQFLSASLGQLVDNLAKEGSDKFKHLKQYMKTNYPAVPFDQLCLLLRKGVYPYDYIDDLTKFSETGLPPREAFFNSVENIHITQQDYDHALSVWKAFDICDLGQYHDLYMETDVHLLADVFENFRELCLDYYTLDPCNFYTSPGLAWQACLKMTGVNLELLTDIDMHLFIERGLRGGISMISHRFAKANNKYLSNYNPTLPSSYAIYLDANNLYGWAMSQALPTHGFQWLSEEEIRKLDISQVTDDANVGYILEVDLEYPSSLHDLHNDYPLAPEKLQITKDMLSPYAKSLLEELHLSEVSVEKLVPNLHNKTKYVVHYRNLKLYQALGLKVVKIHRVMAFHQSLWLKSYIDFNTEKRKLAKNDFEKNFFKLMNNAVFGKTMENLRKRVDVKLVNNEKRLKKLTSMPNFHAFKIFNDDLAAIQMRKTKLYLNRPIYVGFSILEISKILMYDFHYNYIKPKYGEKAKLLFTDTDSLSYIIQTDDIYADMKQDSFFFDFSDYPVDHPNFSTSNKKVLGKMKDETAGIPPEEFVGLKSKMYSLLHGEHEKKAAKGVKKSVVKNTITHSMYKDCLFSREIQMASMTQFRSEKHEIFTVTTNKIGLSPFDDKRYLLEDGITSLAYGHYRIENM